MNDYTTAAQLAHIRRRELLADATYHRPVGAFSARRTGRPSAGLRRPIAAFQTWLAAGQL
jgi:hypothetical protein